MTWTWHEDTTDEPWSVEIEHDCFSEDEPVVVSIHAKHDEGEGVQETLITPSPEQAREMAVALIVSAHAADRENKRWAAHQERDRK